MGIEPFTVGHKTGMGFMGASIKVSVCVCVLHGCLYQGVCVFMGASIQGQFGPKTAYPTPSQVACYFGPHASGQKVSVASGDNPRQHTPPPPAASQLVRLSVGVPEMSARSQAAKAVASHALLTVLYVHAGVSLSQTL